MGNYISATEIAAILPEKNRGVPLITATSTPISLAELDVFIVETEADVEAAAALAGYLVPISTVATAAWQQMRMIVRNGAAAAALVDIFPGLEEAAGHPIAPVYRAAYDRALQAIESGKKPLLGAQRDASETTRLRPVGRGNPTAVITDDWRP